MGPPGTLTERPRDRLLTQSYRKALLNFFRARMRSDIEAEDYVQETLVRILNRPIRNEDGPLEAYGFTVAANLLRDRARREVVRARVLGGPLARVDIADEDPDAEHVLIGKEKVERLMRAMRDLTERRRTILILCRIEGMSHPQIAKHLGISVSAVEKHVAKALRHLMERLES